MLATAADAITASSAWTTGSLIFITWDEAGSQDSAGCCGADPGGGHVLTLAISHDATGRVTSDIDYNHDSLLASIEAALGLGRLASTCDTGSVSPMTDLMGSALP